MTVRVTREAEPQIELYGAYEGAVVSSGENMLASLTFTPTDDYLILVPKNAVNYPQLEEASTPSSYIPTSGSTVTRAADSPLTIAGADVPWPTPTVIGDELVTNGTFDTDSDWTKGTGVTISGGNLDFNATGYNGAFQSISVTSGSVYMLTFDLTVTSGTFLAAVGNGSSGMTELYTTSGSKTLIGVYDGSADQVYVRANPDFVGTIDNVSVKEINPLAVCIQMKGRMTYADEDLSNQARIINWESNASNHIILFLDTGSIRTGNMKFWQKESGVTDQVVGSVESGYTPGINVPFNIASRHGSTFINGAVDGTALTEDTTPVALPDLSSTDLQIAYDFMGNVKQVRIWVVDIGDTGLEEASS